MGTPGKYQYDNHVSNRAYSPRSGLILAVASFAGFGALVRSIGPEPADDWRMANGDVLLLATPAALALMVIASAYAISWRATRGRST